MRHLAKQAAKTFLKIAVAGGLIAYLIHVGALDFGALAALATPLAVAVVLGFTLVMIVVNNFRWLLLLRAQGFDATSRSTLALTFIGLFFNFAMPGGVGGDVVKGYYLLRDHPERKVAAALSVFMDRMSGFFVMLLTATLALCLNWDALSNSRELRAVGAAVGLLLAAFIAFYAVALTPALSRAPWIQKIFDAIPGGRRVRQVYEGLLAYRRHLGVLFGSFALSGVSQLCMVAMHAYVGAALGLNVPLACYFFVVPVGTVVMTLPVSIAGIGVGQAASFFLYKLYLGSENQLGPTATTAIQVATFAWSLIGAYLYLGIRPNRAR